MRIELSTVDHINRILLSSIEGNHRMASGSGRTTKEAAQWLVRRVNRIMEQTEDLIIEMGFLTPEEVIASRSYVAQPYTIIEEAEILG